MTYTILNIKRWRNNLGIRLPESVARKAHLHADQRVRVEVAKGQVIITPLENEWLTLEQRLARFDAALHQGEAMVTRPVGAEQW